MADLFKTSAQLIAKALSNIGALEPGEAPSAEDFETMDGLIDPLIEQLQTEGVAPFIDRDEIPPALFLPLSRLLANAAGPEFGSPMNEQAKLIDEATLRRLTAGKPTYQTLRVEFF